MGNANEKVTTHHCAKDQQEKPEIRSGNQYNKSCGNHIISHQCCDHHATSDECIIKLHHHQIQRGITPQLCGKSGVIDKRRLVFVSLIGLYQTWRLCPAALLYSSIFILPLKRKWIYHYKKYKKEIQQTVVQISIFKDKIKFKEFLDLLKWKDSQDLVFWALDDYEEIKGDDYINCNPLTAAFWIHFNEKLTQLYDPITGTSYKPIICNSKWWMHTYNALIRSKYRVQPFKILSELYFVTMRFKPMQEMIYQSNPESLKPIISYNPYISDIISKTHLETNQTSFVSAYKNDGFSDYGGFVSFQNGCCPDIDNNDNETDDNGIWMISTEYNEYDNNS